MALHRMLKTVRPEGVLKFVESVPRREFDHGVDILARARRFCSFLGTLKDDDGDTEEIHLALTCLRAELYIFTSSAARRARWTEASLRWNEFARSCCNHD